MDPELSIDDCFAAMHATGWPVGSSAVDTRGTRTWFVYGLRGEQKIMGRGPTERDAWRSALKAAEATSEE